MFQSDRFTVSQLDCYFRTPEEVRLVKIFFDHENPGYDEVWFIRL